MNFDPIRLNPIHHIIDPTRYTRDPNYRFQPQVNEDLEGNYPQQANETSNTVHSLDEENSSSLWKCMTMVSNGIVWVLTSTWDSIVKLKNHCMKNKITTFMIYQLMMVFLWLMKLIKPTWFLYLTIIPFFAILIGTLLHLCIATHRSAQQLERETIELENAAPRQRQRQNSNRRQQQGLDQLNERIMEQILLNSVPNRLDLFMTGNNGRMRFMHVNQDLNTLQGTRMQIRLISRGLLRLLAEFIEEQQLQQIRNQRSGLSDEQISQIPIEKYYMPLTSLDEPETCSICIDEFHQEQDLRRLVCNHRFHIKCIDEWLKISSTCPNCKMELLPAGNTNVNNNENNTNNNNDNN